MTESVRKFAMRVDASARIGSGHVMRCLALADELRDHGATVTFISRDLGGALFDLVRAQGYEQLILPPAITPDGSEMPDWQVDLAATISAVQDLAPLDWIVIDHYGIESRWELAIRKVARKVLAIDDLANRQHECDFLLDQNYYRNLAQRYAGRVPPSCKLFLGPQYALLRKEFRRVVPRPSDAGRAQRLFVCFGGADLTGETEKVLRALTRREFAGLTADVVVGTANQRIGAVQALCAQAPNATLHVQSDRMAELMSNADLAIGAGGATTWERLRCGLPTITVVIAENQYETTRDLAAIGAVIYLGRAESLTPDSYEKAIRGALSAPQRLAEMARKGTSVMEPLGDPDGVARLARAMLEQLE